MPKSVSPNVYVAMCSLFGEDVCEKTDVLWVQIIQYQFCSACLVL